MCWYSTERSRNPPCPTSGWTTDILTAYTGAGVGPATSSDPPPSKAGSKTGPSCYVVAFDPTQSTGGANAAPIQVGQTVGFPGFEFWSNTETPSCTPHALVNCVTDPALIPLSWDQTTSSGVAVKNLTLCSNAAGTGCTAPWVHLSLSAVSPTAACQALSTPSLPILGGLVHPKNTNEYTVVWYILANPKGLAGCQVRPVLQFDSGVIASPAVFQIFN